jgi:hypothetical protein
MVADGRLRYIYLPISFETRRPELREWITAECRLVFGIDLMPPTVSIEGGQRVYANNPPRGIDSLFDCTPRG